MLSLCLPNYNHARFLPGALDAILSQSRLPDEMIIMDDASTDNSVEILQDYAARYPFIKLVLSEKNQGAAATLTHLLGMARGRYFYAPAADDRIRPCFIEESMKILERFPAAGLCSTLSAVMDEQGSDEGILSDSPFGAQDAHYIPVLSVRNELWRHGSWVHGNTVVFRRDALIAAGGYRTELAGYADGFVHEVIALTHGACLVPRPLACWRRMAGTLSDRASLNIDKARQVRDAAQNSMTSEYREIFSAVYVHRWRRRWNAGILLGFSRAKVAEWRVGIFEFSSGSGWVVQTFGHVSLFMVGVGYAAVAAVAAALRWFDLGWILAKKVRAGGKQPLPTDDSHRALSAIQ